MAIDLYFYDQVKSQEKKRTESKRGCRQSFDLAFFIFCLEMAHTTLSLKKQKNLYWQSSFIVGSDIRG